jgi:GNAT superfamily N-acetyltransferase
MSEPSASRITYRMSPQVGNAELNALFAAAWPGHTWRDFAPVLAHSLAYVCAFQEKALAGFVNVAWDGGIHAFLLDTTVDPAHQRKGIGHQLVVLAVDEARRRGMHWLHVDYEPHLEPFYRACGFAPALAGLIRLHSAG